MTRKRIVRRKTGDGREWRFINRRRVPSIVSVYRLPFIVCRLSFSLGGRPGDLDEGQAQLVEDPGKKIRLLEGDVSARFLFEHGQPVDHLPRDDGVAASASRG